MSSSEEQWKKTLLPINSTIQEAINNLNQVAVQIVLVVNEAGVLEGTLSDGDIRRGLLKGMNLGSSISNIIRKNPLVVTPEMGRGMVMQLMTANKIHQIPVVDKHCNVVGLHLWDEVTTPPRRPNLMIIMAGGLGTRLRPQTENCPKPMLPVAGKPILEHIIERAKLEGFRSFALAIHYLGEMIEEYFGSGTRLGVRIEYLREQSPLGTAGALGMLNPHPSLPFIVTNGDVMTDVRYGELLDFHIRHIAAATMAVRIHEWQHPFGVVHTKGLDIVGFDEKPIMRSYINAGIYALDPTALEHLCSSERCDMPTLFGRLQSKAMKTVAYPMHEPWLDVGRPDDLVKANSIDSLKY